MNEFHVTALNISIAFWKVCKQQQELVHFPQNCQKQLFISLLAKLQ